MAVLHTSFLEAGAGAHLLTYLSLNSAHLIFIFWEALFYRERIRGN